MLPVILLLRHLYGWVLITQNSIKEVFLDHLTCSIPPPSQSPSPYVSYFLCYESLLHNLLFIYMLMVYLSLEWKLPEGGKLVILFSAIL